MAVSKLFDVCLEYVARKICLVESLLGFPDTIAQKIFHAVQTTGQLELKNPAMSQQILSLFTSAYSDHILTDVNIEGEHLLLADCLDHLILFTHLSTMNVSSCCLGDTHDLLFHIATLKSLKVLILRNNNLTDEGIRKLTAPVRIKKTGPLHLRVLDLSENREVTIRSIKFLWVFSALQLLNLSTTAIHHLHCMQTVPELQEYAKGRSHLVMTALSKQLEISVREMMAVRTKGWAASVIHTWLQQCHQPRQLPVSTKSKARRFYGRSKNNVQENTPAAVSPCSKERSENCRLSLVLIHSTLISTCPSMSSLQPELSSPSSQPLKPSSQISLSSSLLITTSLTQVRSASSLPMDAQQSQAISPCRTCHKGFWQHVCTEHHRASSAGGLDQNLSTGTGVYDLSSVKLDHAELHSADSDGPHRRESGCSPAVSSMKRGRECQFGQCHQQKKVCRDRDISDDDLMLLCQYGYSGTCS